MSVEITNKCDRCGRSDSLHVSHDELVECIEERKTTEATVEQITSMVREIWDADSKHFPAVITISVVDGQLTIQDKISLCGPDEKRSRGGNGCEARVLQLVDEIHLDKKKD